MKMYYCSFKIVDATLRSRSNAVNLIFRSSTQYTYTEGCLKCSAQCLSVARFVGSLVIAFDIKFQEVIRLNSNERIYYTYRVYVSTQYVLTQQGLIFLYMKYLKVQFSSSAANLQKSQQRSFFAKDAQTLHTPVSRGNCHLFHDSTMADKYVHTASYTCTLVYL